MTLRLKPVQLSCLVALSCGFVACSNEDDDPADLETQAIAQTKDYVTGELEALVTATKALRAAAPMPDDDGWNADDDRDAVERMREAWGDARDAYERVEGSIAILFGELDVATDERYDAFLDETGPDDDLFDDEGVTGMHAVERILWAGEHPEAVVEFEAELPGYEPAAFPANEDEADRFRNQLTKRLADDCQKMFDMFEPLALSPPTAFWGVIGSMNEQVEKVTLADTAQDESRYAQRTLDDMRANLEGGRAVYDAFRDWVIDAAGEDVDSDIERGFDTIEEAYAEVDGAAIPRPPADFDATDPSDEALETEFGKLFELLAEQTDIEDEDSLLSKMREAADAMELEEE
jgi:iron uptake system component EfeO